MSSKKEKLEDYEGFVDKFKPKKTTDDCYTPPRVYDAIREWVNDNICSLEGVPVVRPFYPGGDYENYDYPPGCIVLDNPPFSILSKILDHYIGRGIRFFLFAPTLTVGSCSSCRDVTCIVCGGPIEYENGAKVPTSFVTNLDCDGTRVWVAGDLTRSLKEVQKKTVETPSYDIPDTVITSARLQSGAKNGLSFRIPKKEARFIRHLSSMKTAGKELYGGGWLISEKAAAEKAAAEKVAAEKAAAEKAAAEKAKKTITWTLTDYEREIINELNHAAGDSGS